MPLKFNLHLGSRSLTFSAEISSPWILQNRRTKLIAEIVPEHPKYNKKNFYICCNYVLLKENAILVHVSFSS